MPPSFWQVHLWVCTPCVDVLHRTTEVVLVGAVRAHPMGWSGAWSRLVKYKAGGVGERAWVGGRIATSPSCSQSCNVTMVQGHGN